MAHVASEEHATFQWVVRGQKNIKSLKLEVGELSDGGNTLSLVKVGYVRIGRNTPNPSLDKFSPISGLYPDPIIEKDTSYIEQQPISSDEAQAFYQAFLPALTEHLSEKGWTDIYMQHLMDEPIPEKIDSYIEVASFIKGLAPDLKIVEACHAKDPYSALDQLSLPDSRIPALGI